MRAVVIDEIGDTSNAHVSEVTKPVPEAGEVLIQVYSSPINPSDLYVMKGRYWSDKTLPKVCGIEGAGVVVQCGAGTEELLGKRVHVAGGRMWAEFKLAKAIDVVPLLDHITFDEGAILWVNPLTVMMFRELIRKGNHQAVVQDAANSALGKMLIRLCQKDGIPLINIVRSSKSADILRSKGAENVLDSSDADFINTYQALSTSLNATIAFDAISGTSTGVVLSGLCPGGVVYVYGSLSDEPSKSVQASDLIFQGKRVEGLMMPGWLSHKSIQEKTELYIEIQEMMGTVFRPHFTGHYSLEEVQAAISHYKADMASGKVLLHPNKSSLPS